ncbi:MAG: hypothetical protein RMN53_09140 [Anaerolineae bacterium]|nr:hypothetical protein [Anaerolineae bacterium]
MARGEVLIAHADWSAAPAKRWLALALPKGQGWTAQPPQPVGELDTLLSRLLHLAGPDTAVLLGVDFPIGLPQAYAHRVGADDFVALLPQLGRGEWADFYAVAEAPEQISLRRPFYPKRPGAARRQHLVDALGLPSAEALLRRCDRAQPDRPAAAPLFWTLGAQQVGKAAIAGWRDLLGPALRRGSPPVALWPFHGPLAELVQPGRVVVAEAYPRNGYRRLGVRFDRALGGGKGSQAQRRANGAALLAWAAAAGVDLAEPLVAAIRDGFGADAAGEDRFDAVVGLCGLVEVVAGRCPTGEPDDPAVRRIEGWILGQVSGDR